MARLDIERLEEDIRLVRRVAVTFHLAVDPEWYDLALRQEDPHTGRPVIHGFERVAVVIADDVAHPSGAEVRVGPPQGADWSDPDADVRGDIVTVAGRMHGKSMFTYSNPTIGTLLGVDPVADFQARAYSDVYFGNWSEPERDWVFPATCACDMNLCTCNTPDPGLSLQEYQSQVWGELAVAFAHSAKEMQEVFAGIMESFREVSESIAKVFAPLRAMEKKKRPAHAGPPPPALPPLPMTSIHTPPAFARPQRGNR